MEGRACPLGAPIRMEWSQRVAPCLRLRQFQWASSAEHFQSNVNRPKNQTLRNAASVILFPWSRDRDDEQGGRQLY